MAQKSMIKEVAFEIHAMHTQFPELEKPKTELNVATGEVHLQHGFLLFLPPTVLSLRIVPIQTHEICDEFACNTALSTGVWLLIESSKNTL